MPSTLQEKHDEKTNKHILKALFSKLGFKSVYASYQLSTKGLSPESTTEVILNASQEDLKLKLKEKDAFVQASALQEEEQQFAETNRPVDAQEHPISESFVNMQLYVRNFFLRRAVLYISAETLLLTFFLSDAFNDFPQMLVWILGFAMVVCAGHGVEKVLSDGDEEEIQERRKWFHIVFTLFSLVGLFILGIGRSIFMIGGSSLQTAQWGFVLSSVGFCLLSLGLSAGYALANLEVTERAPFVEFKKYFKSMRTFKAKKTLLLKEAAEVQLTLTHLKSAVHLAAQLGYNQYLKKQNNNGKPPHTFIVLLLTLSAFYAAGCQSVPRNLFKTKSHDGNFCREIFVDVSRSADGKQHTEFAQTLDSVRSLFNTPCAVQLSLSTIGEESFGNNNILLNQKTIPAFHASPFGLDCRREKESVQHAFQTLKTTLKPTAAATDILGATHLMSRLIQECPYENVQVYVFSDLRHYTPSTFDFNFLNTPTLLPEAYLKIHVERKNLLPRFSFNKRVSIHVASFHTQNITEPGFVWLQSFWTLYFKKAGARNISFGFHP